MHGNRSFNRRSTPKVKDGKVQKKNNWARTANYFNTPLAMPVIDKEKPGKGCRHVLSRRDITSFISIIPEWNDLSKGLNAIVLAPHDYYAAGYYCTGSRRIGTIHICAWEKDHWRHWEHRFFDDHKGVIERLGVPYEKTEDYVLCKFNECTVRAWQLLHIFLHELGHHHDRMTTQSRVQCAHGESYAEAYALKYESLIWERYREVFDFY